LRIKLHLIQEKPDQLIPINYQYGISSFIYNTIAVSDNSYSKWLHDTGFTSGSKKFKFFTFSLLDIPDLPGGQPGRKVIGNKLQVFSDELRLVISIYGNKSLENFVMGMFQSQKLRIFDKTAEASFFINTVETEPEPKYTDTMIFKTLSPIVLSKKIDRHNAPQYLSPEAEDYFEYFKRNLEEKYITLCLHNNEKVMEHKIRSIKILNSSKSRLIKIKEGRTDETSIRGFDYEFELQANKEFMRIGYETGFGINNSLGFGCVKIISI
jgi:CRISPR-associated endoribonuclease Cas6